MTKSRTSNRGYCMERYFCTHDLSTEEGFAVCTGFFSSLFETLRAPNETETCFCLVICDGKHGFSEWNEALFKTTGIKKEEQKNAKLTATQIFEATLAFCLEYNNILSNELNSLYELVKNETPIVKRLFKTMLEKSKERSLGITFNWKSEKPNKLSVEQGYTLSRSFFLELWQRIAPDINPKEFDAHDFFCMNICLEGESYLEWNSSVLKGAKIPLEEQRKAFLTDEELLSSFTEFCKIFHEKYDKKLQYLMDLLKGMKERPEKFQWEWNLLHKLKAKVLADCIKAPFKWTC